MSSAANGDFVVVWTSYGSSGTDTYWYSVQGQRYASDGSEIGSEFQVNTFTTGGQTANSVAVDADGNFVVVWSSAGSAGSDTSRFSVQGQRYAAALPVDLDIGPGNDSNPINPSSHGNIPVAILGSDSFDVSDVDVMTLAFGPSGASFAHRRGPHFEDVNGDDLTDLIAHFPIEETGIAFGEMQACITGDTLGGIPFEGCDAVRTVPDMGGDTLRFGNRPR